MPRYAVNIGSDFTPFTYQELALPLMQQTEAYHDLQDKYADLQALADVYKQRALKESDSPWAQEFLNYSDTLQQGAEQLSSVGYNMQNRGLFSKLKGQYASAVAPISKGMEREEAWAKQIMTMDPSKRPLVGKMPTLQEFIDNPMARPNVINGADIEADFQAAAAAKSSRIIANGVEYAPIAGFIQAVKQTGINADTIQQLEQMPGWGDFIAEGLSKYDFSGMSEQQKEKIYMEAVSGTMKGLVYSNDVSYQQDPLAEYRLGLKGPTGLGTDKKDTSLDGILPYDLMGENDVKAMTQEKDRLADITEKDQDKLIYNQAIQQKFISKVEESKKLAKQVIADIKAGKESDLVKSIGEEDLKTLKWYIKHKPEKEYTALAERDAFKYRAAVNEYQEGWYGFPVERYMEDTDLTKIYDQVTRRGELGINSEVFKNEDTKRQFFISAVDIATSNIAKKWGEGGIKIKKGLELPVDTSHNKQVLNYVEDALSNGAELHKMKWDSKQQKYVGQGTIKYEDLRKDDKEAEIKALRLYRSKGGEINAVLTIRLPKTNETIEVEAPANSSLLSRNLQNSVNAAYMLSDLANGDLSPKDIPLAQLAQTLGEDNPLYLKLLEIKQRGYLTPEEVQGATLSHKSQLSAVKKAASYLTATGL